VRETAAAGEASILSTPCPVLHDGDARRCALSEVGVVVVDDQEPFRRAAAAVVAATSGFRLLGHAVNGEDALVLVHDKRPDLVLMDVGLPGIDGLEATRRLCDVEAAPVVVLLSTYSLEEIGGEALSCGAAGYLPKERFDSASLQRVWNELGARD
jgi:DNA-binding NarL/FixJ family response regulator